ncbi:MAG: hypothetical protein Q9191_006082 [Dirinaria sp. TL-2023a]
MQVLARNRPRTDLETGFREWTFLIPKQSSRYQAVETDKFFKLGWDLVRKEHTETGQQIIKKLATEDGLAMIKTLVYEQTYGVEQKAKLRKYKDGTLPFFQTISHPDILSSLILETPLDTICTFLFGPNGRRAIKLFQATTSALGALALVEKAGKDEEWTSIAATASLAVLERIVELNQSAQVIPEFKVILNDLTTTIPEQLIQVGSRSLLRIRQRLGVGSAMPFLGDCPPQQKSHRPVFEVALDLPGALSEMGPRHDNDHADIFDIKILPTTDEIRSQRSEYLPSSDPGKQHLPGLAGLLDRQFRLLREDTVGQFRDAVQMECKRLTRPANTQSRPKRQKNGVRNIIHQNVALLRLEFDRRRGLQVVAEFDQPPALAKKGAREREEWWKNSKQLQIDSFVCLVSSTGRAIFFSICDPAPTPPPNSKRGNEGEDRLARYGGASDERPNLFQHTNRASVMLGLVEDHPEDITWINGHLGKACKLQQSLVEFPGILLPSFQPTLQAIQKMSRTLDLPFPQFIAPENQHAADVDLPAPAYSRKRGFAFNLETLTGGEHLRLAPGQSFDDKTFRERSELDDAQRFSTVHALRSCIALIQGPPGTGKSYTGVAIIKALLKNRDAAKLGPIICVCYTNHALDQLLEHLVKDGVEQLIRLGSRSKSELLQDLTLHHVSNGMRPTKTEGYDKYQLYESLDVVLDEIKEIMLGLRDPAHWSNVKDYLETHQYNHFQQLFGRGVDENGFQEVKGRKFNVLNSWIRGAPKRITSTRAVSELLNANLKDMSGFERSALHKYWVQQSNMELNRRFLHVLESYGNIKDKLKKCHQELDLRCLLRAHVIGVTTTGLARNLDVLRRVRAKVLVMEEAGEVLEAHTLTAFLPSVEHAILIGDHEQLRPQINNYEFQHENPRGAQFSLDISLFERLIHPQTGYLKLPYSSLEVQRRMHPSIAELIRSTLYPDLQDHSSVSKYPEVNGMRRRLFWLDHNKKEDAPTSDTAQSFSKTNTWEVEMTAALVSHLVRQGIYGNEDIAVLTPYLGQLQKLKHRLRSSFAIVVGDRDLEDLEAKGLEDGDGEETSSTTSHVRKTTLLNALRIATVDNFQGEEAKVIIVSLVRSNDERRCGFLKTSNRINVLLSRARHGMYVIGNADTARCVPMWDQVITILENDGNIGQSLALCCPRHKETSMEVSEPDDFSILSPEGGCDKKSLRAVLPWNVATTANDLAKCAIQELKMATFRWLVMVSARIRVVGNIPLAATLAQRLATAKSHVVLAWSRAKFDAVTRAAIRSATSHVSLASRTAPGPAHIEARANSHSSIVAISALPSSVKDMMVDYIMGSSYGEFDLDESPCIIPSCGHILTLESMDGHMDMSKYYTMSSETIENPITALKTNSVPFSTADLKNCPLCRKPLRNINRYGRIVRRAWIDEATKKFIVWANAQFLPLASRLEQAEAQLREPAVQKEAVKSALSGRAAISQALDKLSLEPIRLMGSRDEQIKAILKAEKANARYKDIFSLRIHIVKFLHEVDEAEQPISRIHALVQDARNHRGIDTDITDIPSVLQVRNRLLATVLLFRCDYAILFNFVAHACGTASKGNLRDCRLNLELNRKDCENLIHGSRSQQQPAQEVEGLLYYARFVALERGVSASRSDADMTDLVDRARNQLQLARSICQAHPGQTKGLLAEVSEAEKMLRDATFYEPVTNAEKAAVYAAMAQSFQGTGHWYYCANGHPFTVGECGMPMETSRCPQCGATVGGTHHQPAAGVTRAADLEAGFGR